MLFRNLSRPAAHLLKAIAAQDSLAVASLQASSDICTVDERIRQKVKNIYMHVPGVFDFE